MSSMDNLTQEQAAYLLRQLMFEDFLKYAPAVLKVQTTRGQIIPFTLNRPQRILHTIIEKHIKPFRPVRVIGLKSRRMGFSTYFSGRYFWKTSRKPNRYAAQITHEPEATDALFKMSKRFYDFSPPEDRPETKYNNTRLLEFNTKDGQGLNSGFRVATAGKEDFGSGQLLHYCHLSEVSKWESSNTESLLTSILQCVPDDPESEVAFESTAKGMGGVFYDRFWGARYRIFVTAINSAGNPVIKQTVNEDAPVDNNYTAIFLPWFIFEEYSMPVPPGFTLTSEEATIKAKHGLTDEQIYWRRYTLANKCDGKKDVFDQEYPATPEAAFIGSGRPVFDMVKLATLRETLPNPIARYDLVTTTGQWVARPDGRLRVWEEPSVRKAYIIGADVAEGLKDGDFSVADVIDHRTGKQVAQWHGKISAMDYSKILIALGLRYNEAHIACERNNHGYTVNESLGTSVYPNGKIFVQPRAEFPNKTMKRLGWVTSNATRPMMIDNLLQEVNEDSHGISCRETIDEMMTFSIQDNGRMEADVGRKDDRVISIAIAKKVRQMISLPSFNQNPHFKKLGSTGGRERKVDRKAWS